MAKEKKEELSEEKKKISYETEVALLGLMIAIISLIGLLNQGYFGSLITFALVFIFGSWYYVVLLSLIFFGTYLFIKRKTPKFMTTLTTISFILLVLFLIVASSKYEGASLSNWYTYYKASFDRCKEGIHINIPSINQVGGGVIGYSLYALFVSTLGQFMTNVVIVVLVLAFAYLAFRKPIIFIYDKFCKYLEIHQTKKEEKKANQATQNTNTSINNVAQENIDKEVIAKNKAKGEQTHFLTYDIFTENIFDEEQITIEPTSESPFARANKVVKSDEVKPTNNISEMQNLNKQVETDEITTPIVNKEVEQENSTFQDNVFDYENNEVDETSLGKKVIDEPILEIKEEKIIEEPKIIKQEYVLDRDNTQEVPEYLAQNQSNNEEDNNPVINEITNTNSINNEQMLNNSKQIDEPLIKSVEPIDSLNQTSSEPYLIDPISYGAAQINHIIESAKATTTYTEPEEKNVIDEVEPVKEEKKEEKKVFKPIVSDLYTLLAENYANSASDELKDEVETNCLRINQKLEELNIKAKVSNYIIGPCVTRYEIIPEIGVRVSSIVNIQNDLKLALAAVNLRMEAPIPGKSAVGIEVANKKRYPVYLKEVLENKRYIEDKLLVAIGKDLNNNPVTISIDKMPHLLIAGATGSGKSVCINAIIMSLIIRATPDEVKMILVDPKKVEMLPYANMPHLLCPVVTDPKKASNALKKVVIEMDKRYDLFANNGVRNIDSYNKLEGKEKLYKLVVIIDELADLMLVASKEVEESIQRITQLARAAGIYLIVATQRPSVDVITGVIKANIPSRIAFSVSSMVDSRTILDRAGAEDLLGKGDMLMDISGSGSLNRVQGVLVTDEEIFKVVEQVKMKYDVKFNEDFLNLEDDKKEVINNLNELDNTNNGEDELYNDIKTFVIQNQRASTSLIQRYFSLGYARAARMMDRLEQDGIVSASNGIKPREILVKEEGLNDGSSNE